MAIDLTGINNENEFYTNHYLSAIFENDVKDVLSRWKQSEEENIRPPYAQIRTICNNYFSFKNSLEKEKSLDLRLELQKEWLQLFLPSLGYDLQPQIKTLDAGFDIPIIFESKKTNGAPEMWVIEGINLYGETQDPLSLSFSKEQFPAQEMSKDLEECTLDTVITKFVFGMAEPPRWILVVNDSQIMLIDRSKWNEKRMLRFDLPEILGRKEDSTLKATAALLHRESICPDDGIPLLDTLDENSHKHAFSVSEDLKYALREAIELIGNEAITYLQEVRRKGVFSGSEKIDAKDLTRECLRYMYRLLFILYIEARPELGYVPMKSDAYRLGYSLESLRDLEIVKLNSEESKNGFYINDSVQILFGLIYNGLSKKDQAEFDLGKGIGRDLFEIPPLKTHLFDPERTPLLNKVKFRNTILQRVIELMSLSRQGGSNNRRGRISYAQLGINQLGAVYEALLSYQGFFAETDLYEVKKADEAYDELKNAYFVKADDLEKYTADEKVYNSDGTLKKYEKGTFIYRLAGRDREKSASYYTPEVLTKCLVKYALKELLKDKSADDILKLTVCEPAMGSAAFLNEAINQLAEAYLERKQKERGERITHDEYPFERQKVKMYLADNNVFGVDLNPVAVELAEVSLWLNTISKENFVPWFGMQLVCGNSLIGARRQVFKKTLLKKENGAESLWLDEVPERVMPKESRSAGTVYHFLLPDKGMADYKDGVIKELAGENIKKINNWRNSFTKEFSKSEIETLQNLSKTIDKLWASHTEQLIDMRERTTDVFAVWGQEQSAEKKDKMGTRWKDKVLEQELLSKKVRNSSPYRRLKLAMDYWCSLWFWPIDKADLLPTREQYLLELNLILEGNPIEVTHGGNDQLMLFSDTMSKQMQLKLVNELGFVDIDKLCVEVERLALVQELAEKYRFLHWELEFADLFEDKGGFDFVLGNPPWIRLDWNESGILSEYSPLIDIGRQSAKQVADFRDKVLLRKELRSEYLEEYTWMTSSQNFFTSHSNYPQLEGQRPNLYKCFLPIAWEISSSNSVIAFVTDDGIYKDANGGMLRRNCYGRLRYWFNFGNEKKLFAEIGNAKKFELSIYGAMRENVSFDMMGLLYHPSTIDQSYEHDGRGPVPEIKSIDGGFDLDGHSHRIIHVTEKTLRFFCSLYDAEGSSYMETRLPVIHSQDILKVLEKFAFCERRIERLKDDIYVTSMWNETGSQSDGTIARQTTFPDDIERLIISGPHFYVARPFHQSPRRICQTHRAYDFLEITELPENYLPRTNFSPVCQKKEYEARIPCVRWDRKAKVTDFYRIMMRGQLVSTNERTLIAAIMPKGVGHIHSIKSLACKDSRTLVFLAGCFASIVYDFYIKSAGLSGIYESNLIHLPLLEQNDQIVSRSLLLNNVTSAYIELWEDVWKDDFNNDDWTKQDRRLLNTSFASMQMKWSKDYRLTSEYQRRQALLEIDVLVALSLGLNLNDLLAIYRVQFPVMKQNESDTWWDQKGRIIFTCNKGLCDVGFSRPEWNEIKDLKTGTVERKIIDDTLPGGPRERTIVYHAPFDRCDREKDYEVAWKEFEKRFKDKKDTK